jgi:hypothetical protein
MIGVVHHNTQDEWKVNKPYSNFRDDDFALPTVASGCSTTSSCAYSSCGAWQPFSSSVSWRRRRTEWPTWKLDPTPVTICLVGQKKKYANQPQERFLNWNKKFPILIPPFLFASFGKRRLRFLQVPAVCVNMLCLRWNFTLNCNVWT